MAVGTRAKVANTDGLGVVLYAAPRDNARQPAGLLEGTPVTVLERSGDEWTATLVGPMSGQSAIEVRAIGGATDGGMSASEARRVDLRDCPA